MKKTVLAVSALLLANPSFAAEVVPTDLITQGSTCTGVDCNTAETFGFATIKLRENNTRILFDDTSTTGAFPKTDWQLTANDSENGGRNRFSIEDVTNEREILTLSGNAPSYSIYVDNSGDVGIGTDQPGNSLHISRPNSPALRLEQNGTGGFTPATWDIEANEAGLRIKLDGQNLLTVDTTGNVVLAGSLTAGTPAETFPDFVFSPRYQLMPIGELKQFVNSQQHLPDIPSAEEVGENGLNMTEFQVKLLQKVEELTLYTIQQQEEIDTLRKALDKQS